MREFINRYWIGFMFIIIGQTFNTTILETSFIAHMIGFITGMLFISSVNFKRR